MNANIFEGKWQEMKGKVKAKWAMLTDNDLDYISGRAEELKGTLKKRYGYEKDRADREVDEFLKTIQ